MKRIMNTAIGVLGISMWAGAALAGQASTSATAGSGWGHPGGMAGATANFTGAPGGQGLARTHTQTGQVNLARGLAVGYDHNGLDFSYSHAIAPQHGPAYAGTLNMSIGANGEVNGSYGGVLAQGGHTRTVEAGGLTRSHPAGGTAQAHATGNASPRGVVQAQTHSYNRPAYRPVHRPAPRVHSIQRYRY